MTEGQITIVLGILVATGQALVVYLQVSARNQVLESREQAREGDDQLRREIDSRLKDYALEKVCESRHQAAIVPR